MSTFKERISSFIAALPALITPVIILGGIYAGFLTPSESAAIAGVYAVAIGFLIYRELTFESLLSCLKDTAIIYKINVTGSLKLLFLATHLLGQYGVRSLQSCPRLHLR